MRGKLRDKRADLKRDNFKRDLRRRVSRRENRIPNNWLSEQFEDENDYLLDDGDEDLQVEKSEKK